MADSQHSTVLAVLTDIPDPRKDRRTPLLRAKILSYQKKNQKMMQGPT